MAISSAPGNSGTWRPSGPAREVLIRVAGLAKAFHRHTVLDSIDLELFAGEIVAISGANGCGKTTLLRCLAQVTRPTAGTVRWAGQRFWRDPTTAVTVGLCCGDLGLAPDFTPRENLWFAARMARIPAAAARIEQLLVASGLPGQADQFLGRLSRGQRQRLAIARAVLASPRLLFLDEPFAALDANGQDWLQGCLERLRGNGGAVCLVDHDGGRVTRLADRRFELAAGRLRSLGEMRSATVRLAPDTVRSA